MSRLLFRSFKSLNLTSMKHIKIQIFCLTKLILPDPAGPLFIKEYQKEHLWPLRVGKIKKNKIKRLHCFELTKESACKHTAGRFRRGVRGGISVEVL